MIDKDLALLYGVETKRINEQVKRNLERFPEDFMFQLTQEECLRSQIATLNTSQGKHFKYMPYAFTSLRKSAVHRYELLGRIETIEHHQLKIQEHLSENDQKFEMIFKKLEEPEQSQKQGIFFDGQIYDAYSFIATLIRKAKTRIILIDNYIDDTVLALLDKRAAGVDAKIYTTKMSNKLQLDNTKHNTQYPSITIKTFSMAHDRFLIVDNEVYLIGASIKDLGKKWFGFTLMENTNANDLISRLL